MRNLLRVAALSVLAGLVSLFVFAGPASANTLEPTDSVFAIGDVEPGLMALFPLVILVSSLLLKPSAADKVKQVMPLVVGLIVSVLYFVTGTWPGMSQEVLVSVGALIALASKLYDPISALSKLIFAGRGLNSITGPGIVGPATSLEGD